MSCQYIGTISCGSAGPRRDGRSQRRRQWCGGFSHPGCGHTFGRLQGKKWSHSSRALLPRQVVSACVSPSMGVSLTLAATAETSREGHTWCGRRTVLTGAMTMPPAAGLESHLGVVAFVLRRFCRTRAEFVLLEAGGSTLTSPRTI